jgi:hypothetical protein
MDLDLRSSLRKSYKSLSIIISGIVAAQYVMEQCAQVALVQLDCQPAQVYTTLSTFLDGYFL